jgi:hypothetical protein
MPDPQVEGSVAGCRSTIPRGPPTVACGCGTDNSASPSPDDSGAFSGPLHWLADESCMGPLATSYSSARVAVTSCWASCTAPGLVTAPSRLVGHRPPLRLPPASSRCHYIKDRLPVSNSRFFFSFPSAHTSLLLLPKEYPLPANLLLYPTPTSLQRSPLNPQPCKSSSRPSPARPSPSRWSLPTLSTM